MKWSHPRTGPWFLACLLGLGLTSGAGVVAPPVDFNHDIRPILSDHCFACHGPDTQKVKGGLRLDRAELALKPAKSGTPAIVPGKPDASELVRRILAEDEDDLMPPPSTHKPLTAAQKDLLKLWITQGAEYQGHWAYRAPMKPAVPAGVDPIDFLVQRRLQSLGRPPEVEADRRTLARRLYFDLVGLPPAPDAVAAFERDPAPDAYARLVERLLASPHHGERMAIPWLDAVRFADTIGYHSDNPRPIWPYRDYVIQSFNENKPFDQFTREQLAGDLLPRPTLDQKVASAFNRLLLTTEEGGAQEKDYEARYLTDRVRAVGAVWLGQTIGCAQCHDHKFDPYTMRDFYSLGAFFADIKEPILGSRGPGLPIPTPPESRELDRHRFTVARLQHEFDGPRPELTAAFAAWQLDTRAALAAEPLWPTPPPAAVESAQGATLKVRDDGSIQASDKAPDTDVYRLRFTHVPASALALRIEVMPDDALPAKGPGRADDGSCVLTEVTARIETEGRDPRPVRFVKARSSCDPTRPRPTARPAGWSAAAAIDGRVDTPDAGWAVLPEFGPSHRLVLEFAEPLSVAAGETLVVELHQRHGPPRRTLGRFRIAFGSDAVAARAPVVAPLPGELAQVLDVAEPERTPAQREQLWAHFRNLAPDLADLRRQLTAARRAAASYEASLAHCLVTERAEKPRAVRILPRGNFLLDTGDVVQPALPAFLAPSNLPARPLHRLDLADWLVARENPLTARVVINRLWKQFFGLGLSKVLDDFGAQGEPPPNPELLDWLACEFMDNGWNVRHMIRLIVHSATYRQRSTAPRDLLTQDPENRWLARQGRWRLEAELVRDNALTLAGLLQPTVGGPSARPYQPDGYWENLNFPVRTYEPSPGADQYRRGLYTWWQRSFVHPSLLAFDAPSREECTAERNRSNIPQQALVLLNDPTYVEAARGFATRILQECRGDDSARLTWAWQQTLARAPRPEELTIARTLLTRHLLEYRQDRAAAEAYLRVGATLPPAGLDAAELAAWTDVARTLLNLHETITRS